MTKKNSFLIIIPILLLLSWELIFKKMTRGMRNNNPFNLRDSGSLWLGLIGRDDQGFCQFIDLKSGVRAGILNLKNGYFKQRLSIEEIVNRYAPAVENNVDNYIDLLCGYSTLFVPTYVPDNLTDYMLICKGIVRMEQGFDAVSEDMMMKYLQDSSVV